MQRVARVALLGNPTEICATATLTLRYDDADSNDDDDDHGDDEITDPGRVR